MAQSQRTPEELNNPDYNYFLAFKIDITETDFKKIETTVKKKMSSTSGSVLERRLGELKADILQVMADDSARAKEADAAKKFKLQEAVQLVEMLGRTRTELFKSELASICSKASEDGKFFTEQEFFSSISYLSGKGVKIIDNLDPDFPMQKFQESDKKLVPLGCKSLYEFLDLPANASESEIDAKQALTYKESQKKSDLKLKQSISGLIPLVKEILLNSKKRKNYDRYILLRERVWSEFDSRKANGIKEITWEEYKNYVDYTKKTLNVSIDEAESVIAIGCKFFLLTLIGTGSGLEECPFCGSLNKKEDKSCSNCGKSLEKLCWNCSNQIRIGKSDTPCSRCGATDKAHAMYLTRCQELDKLIALPAAELPKLQAAVLNLKNVVPKYDASPTSVIVKKVKEGEEIIADRVKTENELGGKYREEDKKIRKLIAERKYQTAQSAAKALLTKFASYNADSTNKLLSEINAVMQTATQQLNLAKQAMARGDSDSAVSASVKALGICSDYNEARQILKKFPPKPVTNVRCSLEKGKVKLEWDDSQKNNCVYTVIKKAGTAPANSADGIVVATDLTLKFCEDSAIMAGVPYFYGVVADLCGVQSAICVCKTSVSIYPDIANAKQAMVEGKIKVNWDSPAGVTSIKVYKQRGVAVVTAQTGAAISIDSNNGFTDADCDSSGCSYLVICEYKSNGATIRSKGVQLYFKPYYIPKAAENLVLKRINGTSYGISGSNINSETKLYFFTKKPSIATGVADKIDSFASASASAVKLDLVDNGGGNFTFTAPKSKTGWLYAVNQNEQLYAAAKPVYISTKEGISGIKCTENGSMVTIACTIDQDVSEVCVKTNSKGYVYDETDEGDLFRFPANAILANGSFTVKLRSNTVSYITLFAHIKGAIQGEEASCLPITLPNVIDSRQKQRVMYALEYKANNAKSFPVTVKFESDNEITLPEFVLVAGSPRPLSKSAGEPICTIPSTELKKGLFSHGKYTGKVTINASPMSAFYKISLFISDDGIKHIQMKEVTKL